MDDLLVAYDCFQLFVQQVSINLLKYLPFFQSVLIYIIIIILIV